MTIYITNLPIGVLFDMKIIHNFLYLLKSFLKYGKKYFCLSLIFAFVSPVLVYIDTTIMQVSMQSIQDKMPFSHVAKTLLFYLVIAIVIYFISEWHARYSAKEKVKIQNKMNSYIYLKAKKQIYII